MKIGILQCGHIQEDVAAQHGDYSQLYQQMLAGYDFEFLTFFVVDMEMPNSIHEADGWLITGSRYGAYDDHPFIGLLEDFIREAYAAAVPLVGICFGHQIIAQALGGKVIKIPTGWTLGHHEYEFDTIGKIALNAWHQDQVVKLPPDAKSVARSETCEFAALVYDDRAYSVQAHPEFSNDFIASFVPARRGTPGYPDALMDQALKETSKPNSNALIAKQIATFYKQPRKAANV